MMGIVIVISEGLVEWEESLLCIDQRPETRGPVLPSYPAPIPRVSGGQGSVVLLLDK